MENMKNILISVGAAVVVMVFGFMFMPRTVTQSFGANPGPDYYGVQSFFGGFLRGNYIATTTTGTAVTLRVQDVMDKDTISVLQGGGSTLTYTFFASSTAKQWLPKAGMTQDACFLNATTTAGATLTFAAGTGIDLQVATSTGSAGGAMDLTIAPNATACFRFIRKAATASAFDIEANLVEYADAD